MQSCSAARDRRFVYSPALDILILQRGCQQRELDDVCVSDDPVVPEMRLVQQSRLAVVAADK